ncbi:MAG: protein containing Planctomycete extracellular domain protein, partial [Planctomycetota bacterium]
MAKRKRHLALETLDARRLLAGDMSIVNTTSAAGPPVGATASENSEVLLGRVAVTPVFLESNGNIDTETQNWTPEEIQSVMDKIIASGDWWVETLEELNTVHTLEFVYDDGFATTPFSTSYEGIDRNSEGYLQFAPEFYTAQGYDGNDLRRAGEQFNNDQRALLDTDWAFTIFVVDSSDDPDGFFAPGGSFRGAFAVTNGPFYVVPSGRPTSTFAHELGHIFWAFDEYLGGDSSTSARGYYNEPNSNGLRDAAPGFQPEPSIMADGLSLQTAFEQNTSPASTLAHVGWKDSDGNGIFDFADVPLH